MYIKGIKHFFAELLCYVKLSPLISILHKVFIAVAQEEHSRSHSTLDKVDQTL